MADVEVTVRDIDDARQVLGACLNYFTALDLAEKHRHLTTQGTSAITQELERLKERYDAYMGDHLLQQHELELSEEPEEPEEDDPVEDDDPEPETPYPDPRPPVFGNIEFPKQEGRVVSASELRDRDEIEPIETGPLYGTE